MKESDFKATHKAADVPKEKWRTLISARGSFLAVNIPYDCRNLLWFIREAEEHRMWEVLGYADLDELVRKGLRIDPQLAAWAKIGLEAITENKPVPLDEAVRVRKADEPR